MFVVVGSLAGCAQTSSPAKPATPAPVVDSVPPTPTAAPTAPAPLPANALFRITARAVQASGAAMDLVQTVYAPTAPTPADIALVDRQCNEAGAPPWTNEFPSGYEVVHTTITATAEPLTAVINTDTTVPAMFDLNLVAFRGDYRTFQAYCAPGLIVFPGTAHGVGVVSSANHRQNIGAPPRNRECPASTGQRSTIDPRLE